MDSNKKVLIGALMGAIALAAIGAVVYFSTQKKSADLEKSAEKSGIATEQKAGENITAPSLGETIYDKVENVSNPASSMPQTNPFETKSNPYSDSYKNPFE